jgi:iron-sulfur cluster assembly accessory protein
MSCTRALFQKPITGTAVSKIFKIARNGSAIHAQVAKNATRTISSFSSTNTGATGAINTNTTVHNHRNNITTKPRQQPHQKLQQQQQYHSHTIHSSETATNRFGAAKKNKKKNNNILRRSMVTITQTKSSDVAPLFMDDVSSSSSSQSPSANVPTYVVNEDTNLIVTESCLKQIEQLLIQRRARAEQPEIHDDGYFLRVFVDAGGCSGFQYQFEVDNELDDDEDLVVIMAKLVPENNDSGNGNATIMRPRVVVDETSMGFLEGSTIDYVIEMIKSAFVISDNPQSESACGCGSSFAMKNFEKFGTNN